MNIRNLNGKELKKLLNAEVVRKRYHNKHVDKSGNFGFTIIRNNQWYNLHGDYDKNGNIYRLYFGDFAGYYRQNLTNIFYTIPEKNHLYAIVDAIKRIMFVVENQHIKEV